MPDKMRNIALRLQYDGSAYHGWQVQKTEVTVAETLEKALSKVMKHPVKVVGCGRTDAGVHALRYCANFRTDCTIPVARVPLAVNARLPGDISVTDAVEAPEDFNAIGSCIQKEYIYRIHNSRVRDAFLEHRACFYPYPLEIETLQKAGAAFEGRRKPPCAPCTGAGPSARAISLRSPSAPTDSFIIWFAPSWARWSMPPTASSPRRRFRSCSKRATAGLPARPCRRRVCT